jgi:predicted outer membrane repeat protein
LVGMICIPAELDTKHGVVYYISPTESLSSCPGNSSCPPGQLCHTMDYLAERSHEFFSSDHVSVTLILMCGIHNYTKDLTVQNLTSFIIKGTAESRKNVVIDHQFITQINKHDCTIIQFFNVSFVNVTNLTMKCPAISLKECHITVKNSNVYGYLGTRDTLSFINITGRRSQALLDNCTFKENCFITSNYNGRIIVSNSTFKSYRHQINSMIMAFSSVVILTGNVNFTNSGTGTIKLYLSSGTAVFLRTTHPELKSLLNISTGATVYFVNLTSNSDGGAVYGENAIIHVGIRTRVVFMHNSATYSGGAAYLSNSMIIIGAKSDVTFTYNCAAYDEGGAVWLTNGTWIVESEASLNFSNNFAVYIGGAVILIKGEMITDPHARLSFYNNSANQGGALYLDNSTVTVNGCTIFYNNRASNYGGAMYFLYGSMYTNKFVKFIMNTAQIQGGAIYIEASVHSSIFVDNSSEFFLFNNSAFQGGAIYVIPSSFAVTVGYQSRVLFRNNTALDVGGAVYAEMQPAAPCLFMITDYSAEIYFLGNHANRGIGHHMYGTSVRNARCDYYHIGLVNKQGKAYCWSSGITANGYINITFDPGVNETLSPVSSAPQRVCLCDSNGRPQCANFSQIFTNVSIYHGETFTLSAHVVGYDFGTTVGIVHAGFLNSNPFSQLRQSQYNQQVNSSKICTNLEYTVLTRYNRELLLLQYLFCRCLFLLIKQLLRYTRKWQLMP